MTSFVFPISILYPTIRMLLAGAVACAAARSAAAAPTLAVPARIDHQAWEDLLEVHVDSRGLVDYAGWKASATDEEKLDAYLAQFAVPTADAATGRAEIAALVNAYNAFTVRWILDNYPVRSIRETSDSWDGARWTIGGRVVSLDEIEHKNLRILYGWKVHAIIVCAARSCPPLQRSAYTEANLEQLTAEAFRAWLAREDLNRYAPEEKRVFVSPIFKWFREDFEGDGALAKVLARFGPPKLRGFFAGGKFSVRYLDYHWGLNAQGEIGADYRPGLSALLKSIF